MKSVPGIALLLAAFACSQGDALRLPVAPDPPNPPVRPSSQPSGSLAWLWVLVVKDSGVCLDDAAVTVVSGQRVGQSITQTTPCSVWDYDGGILFMDLTPGVAMTIRVSAPGHVSQEQTLVPSSGSHGAVEFSLAKIP